MEGHHRSRNDIMDFVILEPRQPPQICMEDDLLVSSIQRETSEAISYF